MNYDKKSFLAGIGVGRTLKGWASATDDPTGGLQYVIGEPLERVISAAEWDPELNGATYEMEIDGYLPGEYGVQIGLPSETSTVNAQAVAAAALSIPNVTLKSSNDVVTGVQITLSAVNPPTKDLTIAFFGLEETP